MGGNNSVIGGARPPGGRDGAMSAGPEYGRAFVLWRDAALESWESYARHRFVHALGDGTLPRSAFLHYMKQDYVFLMQYARAWSLGVAKSDSRQGDAGHRGDRGRARES